MSDADVKGPFALESGELTLYTIFNRLIHAFLVSDRDPAAPEASTNTARHLLIWARRGTPLRALLLLSVGTIALLALIGLLVFAVFFVVATINAIVISLLVSLAAVGGFLALFFLCIVAFHIGALVMGGLIISTATISAIVLILIAAGCIGLFWTVWFAAREITSLAKRSFSMKESAVSDYSGVWHHHHHNISKKTS